MDWFYTNGRSKHGPIDEDGVRVRAEKGFITGDTLLWHEGLDGWKKASELGFAPAAPEPPPAVPEPAPEPAASQMAAPPERPDPAPATAPATAPAAAPATAPAAAPAAPSINVSVNTGLGTEQPISVAMSPLSNDQQYTLPIHA